MDSGGFQKNDPICLPPSKRNQHHINHYGLVGITPLLYSLSSRFLEGATGPTSALSCLWWIEVISKSTVADASVQVHNKALWLFETS